MTRAARRGPPRTRAVTSAGEAIAAMLAFHGISDEIRAQRIVTEWSELVGARIAQRARPDGISDRVLWIEVATSAWLHELNLLRAQLVQNLVDRVGEPRLFDDVRFRLAGRARREPRPVPPPARRIRAEPRAPAAPASGVARERIVREVERVDDAELRELIARVRIVHDR